MTIAFVQQAGDWGYDVSGPPFNKVITMPAATQAGNLIVVNVAHLSTDTATASLTITDSASNTYVQTATINSADAGPPSNNAYISQWVCFNANPATTVTATVAVTSKLLILEVAEFSGVASTRTANEYTGAALSLAATNQTGDLVVSMMGGRCANNLADCVGTGTGWTWLPSIDQAASNAQLIRGGWIVAGGSNIAGPSWSGGGLSSHGIITTSFVPSPGPNPISNAGVDQTVVGGATVTLNGSGSQAQIGSITTYDWVQTSGPAVVLSGTGATRTFPAPITGGTLTFQLTVTNTGGYTAADSMSVAVTPGATGVPTLVQQASGWTYPTGAPLTLVLSMPAATKAGNTIIVNIGHGSTDTASATMTVTDSAGNTYTRLATINSSDSGPPSNNAYESQWACIVAASATTVTVTNSLTSRVLEAQVAEFSGVTGVRTANEYAGSGYALNATNSAGDLVVAMMGGTVAGNTTDCVMTGPGWTPLTDVNQAASNALVLRGAFQVTAAANVGGPAWSGGSLGGHGLVTTSFIPAQVRPVANAGPDQSSVEPGTVVTVSGAGSVTAVGTIIGYTWSQVSGSPVVLNTPFVMAPSFTAPLTVTGGDVVLGLTVTNSDGSTSTEDTVTVSVLRATALVRSSGAWTPRQIVTRSGGSW